MDTVCVVYLHNGIVFNHEEEQIMFFIGKWMETRGHNVK
jgi:hypothetical protein